MRYFYGIFLFSIVILLSGCVTEFIPETNEDQQMLVVEGLITDQPEAYTIKLSKSLPLGEPSSAIPLGNCYVTVTDDLGNVYNTQESVFGTYVTNPMLFRGVVGRKYSLHITTNGQNGKRLNYESFPVEMKPVPPIDSLYYEKRILKQNGNYPPDEGAQVFLNTHSADNSCRFYRWEFDETWEIRVPFTVPNSSCWININSSVINVKSTAAITASKVDRFPLNFISNETDRLKYKYSMQVKQYSLSEDEFAYWDKLRNISEQVGGLYDITPSSIPSNIMCIENPGEKILGYFSVSATSSKRVFIKNNFTGIIDLYSECIADTIWKPGPIPNLGIFVWVIIVHEMPIPAYRVTTFEKGCYDCTVRGTNQEPSYWRDDK
jgi:hypothetical protein